MSMQMISNGVVFKLKKYQETAAQKHTPYIVKYSESTTF